MTFLMVLHAFPFILCVLGIKKIDLMTNNPKKIDALKSFGVIINQRIPLSTDTNKHNQKYISTKIKKLGHLL